MKNNFLIWLDLEMTGLNPFEDSIIEIGVVITDFNLNIIEIGPNIIIKTSSEKLKNMNDYVLKMHKNSGIYDLALISDISIDQAENEILEFVNKFCKEKDSPLCGNSIWVDRMFLVHQMPKLNNFFHYRNIDVSTVKELVKNWYFNSDELIYQKKKLHRATDDILESIAELLNYKKNVFDFKKLDSM